MNAEARIAQRELELANLQANVTTPLQIELNFVQETLDTTLSSSVVLASTVLNLLDELGLSVEEGLRRNGG